MNALNPVHHCKGDLQPLECLLHVTEKKDKSLKGRACADGRRQRHYITKEQSTFPTVSTKALMISYLIDATERRDVETVDIPGAFLQTAMDHLVYETLRGDVALQLVKTNPTKYRPLLQKNRHGQPYIINEL